MPPAALKAETAPPDSERLSNSARSVDRVDRERVARKIWPEAYRVALLTTGDRDTSEEIAQESTATTLANLERLSDEANLLAWVRRVASNRSIDVLRSAHRRRSVPGGSAEEIDGLRPRGTAWSQTSDPALAAALARLAPEDRLAVVLRHVFDYRSDEVADLLGVPAGTARSRISRSLKALRTELERTINDE